MVVRAIRRWVSRFDAVERVVLVGLFLGVIVAAAILLNGSPPIAAVFNMGVGAVLLLAITVYRWWRRARSGTERHIAR